MNNKIKKYKHIIVTLVLIIFVVLYYQFNPNEIKKGTVDPDKIMDAIKHLESENPPRIGENPTDEEIFNSPHVKQIRIALNGYLNGTNEGLEDGATYLTSEKMKCGLDNFDKTYYQSKFVILDAMDNDWGGILAYIAFIDKPDTVFWVWVYGTTGEQRLRMLCEKPIADDEEADVVNEIVRNSTYTY
jgi:hypothetical protein